MQPLIDGQDKLEQQIPVAKCQLKNVRPVHARAQGRTDLEERFKYSTLFYVACIIKCHAA